MRRCTVHVDGIQFTLKYKDFLYDLVNAIEANTGHSVSSIHWNGGEKYVACLRGGDSLPVSISSDRRCRYAE